MGTPPLNLRRPIHIWKFLKWVCQPLLVDTVDGRFFLHHPRISPKKPHGMIRYPRKYCKKHCGCNHGLIELISRASTEVKAKQRGGQPLSAGSMPEALMSNSRLKVFPCLMFLMFSHFLFYSIYKSGSGQNYGQNCWTLVPPCVAC